MSGMSVRAVEILLSLTFLVHGRDLLGTAARCKRKRKVGKEHTSVRSINRTITHAGPTKHRDRNVPPHPSSPLCSPHRLLLLPVLPFRRRHRFRRRRDLPIPTAGRALGRDRVLLSRRDLRTASLFVALELSLPPSPPQRPLYSPPPSFLDSGRLTPLDLLWYCSNGHVRISKWLHLK